MTAIAEPAPKTRVPWVAIAWLAVPLLVCYALVLQRLILQWWNDPDMGHGFFVPLVAGYIVWQRRQELLATEARPTWWGLLLVVWGGLQLLIGTLGVELFTARTALVVTLIGVVWTVGGTPVLRKLAFPLFLLFFMVPIPAVVYNSLTFPLQILATRIAAAGLLTIGIPVLREGNILDLPSQQLSVVEACSGIRSLLSLTFLSLVYGYFFEKRSWLRVVLFLATIPVALAANAGRVMVTGILSQIRTDLAEGFFHESTGMVIFLSAGVILFFLHRAILLVVRLGARRGRARI
ncbi:MAG TPA: exosortase/archaeosortase family protein [Bryobacteraceae bacterium]